MGTFGLGGLHRKSTWLHPVATIADLPPTAVDGSVVVIRDIDTAYEYNAALPGWVPLTSGGGSGHATSVDQTALREVQLAINTVVGVGTSLNIQTGAGGGPATVTGDATVELPASGALFAAAAIVQIFRNGQSLTRGTGLGVGEAQWTSFITIAFSHVLRPGDVIRVVSPLPYPP